MLDDLKIAIVCDWLTVFAGAERVVYELSRLFPKATIYTSLFDDKNCAAFKDRNVVESWLRYMPFARRFHRLYLPFMPLVFERIDLSEYDIVISSSHSASKGIITKPGTLHISYCHSPMRYVWDQSHSYQKNFRSFLPLKFLYSPILHRIRQWDRVAADRVDRYISNSKYISKRIKKYYKRDSTVIYPPVNLDFFRPSKNREDYYLAVGRLIPYKRFDLLVSVFNELKLPLIIVGDGPDSNELKKMANSNIKFLGKISDDELKNIYSSAKALIFPQVEDFGIVPLEAMASGTPVIAYSKGGAMESVTEGVSGIFFHEQNEVELKKAIEKFEKMDWNTDEIVKSVNKFSPARFRVEILHFMEKAWKEHKKMLV